MNTSRRPSFALVAVVAVAALVAGSIGTAVAAPTLTKGKVKKIATRVVKKQASSLSVADAQTLAGQPASSFRTTAYRYRLMPATPATSHEFTFPGLPAGSYQVTYSVLWSGTLIKTCWIEVGQPNPLHVAVSYTTTNSLYTSSNAAAPVQVAADPPRLRCETAAPTAVYDESPTYPSYVAFTRIDTLVDGTAGGG